MIRMKLACHTHYLPKQEILDDLLELIKAMQQKSIDLGCDMVV